MEPVGFLVLSLVLSRDNCCNGDTASPVYLAAVAKCYITKWPVQQVAPVFESVSTVNLCLSGVKYAKVLNLPYLGLLKYFFSILFYSINLTFSPSVSSHEHKMLCWWLWSMDQSKNKAVWMWVLLAEKGYRARFSSLILLDWSTNSELGDET